MHHTESAKKKSSANYGAKPCISGWCEWSKPLALQHYIGSICLTACLFSQIPSPTNELLSRYYSVSPSTTTFRVEYISRRIFFQSASTEYASPIVTHNHDGGHPHNPPHCYPYIACASHVDFVTFVFQLQGLWAPGSQPHGWPYGCTRTSLKMPSQEHEALTLPTRGRRVDMGGRRLDRKTVNRDTVPRKHR